MRKIISLSIPEAMSKHYRAAFVFVFSIVILNITIHAAFNESLYGSYFETFFNSDFMFGLILMSTPFIGRLIISRVQQITILLAQITDRDTSDQFEQNEYRRFNRSLGSYFLPIIVAIIGVFPVLSTTGLPWILGVNQQIYKIFLFVFFIFIGALGWYYLAFIIVLNNIHVDGIKKEPFESLTSKIRKISRFSMDIFATGFLLYIFAIIGITTIPPFGKWILETGPVGRLLVIPIAGAVFSYFYYIQNKMHLLLATSKEGRLENIDKLIKKAFSHSTKLKEVEIDLLFKLRAVAKEEPEWPLDITASATIVGGILIPVIGTIKDLLIK